MNYKQLVQIDKESKSTNQVQVLAFPCNQFGNQEPGTNDEISEFATKKYGAEFPIFEKIHTNGADTHPAYAFLRQNSSLYDQSSGKSARLPWSWSKFLLTGDGKTVLGFYTPDVAPLTIVKELNAKM